MHTYIVYQKVKAIHENYDVILKYKSGYPTREAAASAGSDRAIELGVYPDIGTLYEDEYSVQEFAKKYGYYVDSAAGE